MVGKLFLGGDKGENFVIELLNGSLSSVGSCTILYTPLPSRTFRAHSQNLPPFSGAGLEIWRSRSNRKM